MKKRFLIWMAALLGAASLHAQPQVIDCQCLSTQAVLNVTNCQAVVPDLCLFTQCIISTVQPPPPVQCGQTPLAGTLVGPGITIITVTVTNSNGLVEQCLIPFNVTAPANGPFALICAPNKTVECGTTWTFNQPTPTNFCCPQAGTVGNGVTPISVITVTNGTCPQIITRTWTARDSCGHIASCSQIVTVVDTTPPVLPCTCLTSGNAAFPPIPLTVTNCSDVIPDFCQIALFCATDNCGPLTCTQSPPAGTIVGPGMHPITVSVFDCAGNMATCPLNFTVVAPATGPFALICAPNKTVECGTTWTFNQPTPTNYCCPQQGTVSNGVTLISVTTTTNGTCPTVYTRTWTARDGCGVVASCSQIVTVVDTTPPVLDCQCLQNNPLFPLTVTGCSNVVPDFCLLLSACATDSCGPLTCSQSPPAGTVVFPGVHPIAVTVTDCAGNTAACPVNFTVIAPPGGCQPCTFTTNFWNSGMGGGVALPPSTPDPNYVLVSAPPGGCTGPAQVLLPSSLPVGPWVANGPNSQWIGAGPTANCQEGVYHYRLCFFMPCTNDAAIIGQWAVDDNGAIHLNGQPTGNTVPSQQYPNLPGYGWFPVSITNGFVCGTNCLDFYVTNAIGGINPTGLRAELTNIFNDCCCPPAQRLATVNSGADVNGLLAPQAPDNQFTLTCAPPGVTATVPVVIDPTAIPGVWLPNSATSQWIGPDPFNNAPAGVYCYTMTFTLPCPPGVPMKASLTGRWTADDWANIELNGQPTGHSVPSVQFPLNGFDIWHPISITNGFVSGLNSLTFYVTNAGGPTGLRLEMDINSSCCDCTNIACVVSITCPPNQTALTCSNSAVVPYVSPIASSTCGPITSVVCAPPSGSAFPLGPTTVTCTATDAGGNSASCSFIVTVALDPNCCTISPVLSLFSGTGTSGLLPAGFQDLKFKTGAPLFTTPSPYVPGPIHPSWLPNSALSKWVGPRPGFQSSPGGVFVYTNRFFLCSTNQASITGRWTADDSGQIFLNGAPTPNILPASWGFLTWYPVSITSGFVPGWNTLTFRTTNYSSSVTGLRTEITGSACCNSCVTIACPANKTTNICTTGVVVNYPAPTASSACAQLTSVSCAPASGSVFPLGVNTVTCTAVDALGNAATCSFNVTVQSAQLPVIIMCPPNQTILVCSNSAKAYYKVKATGQVGPVTCSPPSSSTFPVGTNIVVCTATNACGQVWACSFNVIVKNHLLGAPDATITAGLPDNFVLPAEASPQSACMVAAYSGFPFWKGFDVVASDTLFGHRFTGLPNNIAKAELVVRMKPNIGDPSASNDGIFVGLPVCTLPSFRYVATISTLPGAGGTWNPGHPATTFTLNLGVLNPLIISDMNSQTWLDVVVHDDTAVDYMQLRIWRCPPPSPGIGVPYDVVGGATTALRPITGTGIGIGPSQPAICVFPNPTVLSGISLQPGAAKALTFTTVLDFEAPEGAGIDIVLPPDPRNTNGMPYLSFRRKSGPGGYCVKTARLYDDEPDISYRSSAIGTNGDLFPSFTWDAANIETNVLLYLNHLPGVTGVVMTVTIDLATREATLEFPDCIWTADHGRKGWDGCIYGNGTPSKGTNKTARIILGPRPPHIPMGGITEMSLLSTGLSEFLVEDPEIDAMGRRWGDGHVTLMKAYDDGEKISFVSHGEGGGVHTDLGHAASFSIGIHHFEDGEMPEEEQLFLMRGVNPLALTNRPSPPTIPLRLIKTPGGVACTVDFSDLAAESITVQLWSNGVLIAQGSGPGSAIEAESPLIIDRWPDRLAQVSVNGELRLTCGELMSITGIQGDEIRIIPELPQGVELPAYIGSLECLVSEGMDSVLFGLQTTLACPPDAVIHIARSTEGVALTWDCDGYLLQGAEEVTGPWFDLGVDSPASMSTSRPWRFFRLRGR